MRYIKKLRFLITLQKLMFVFKDFQPMYERFVLVPFFAKGGEKDPFLSEKLKDKISGFINWGLSLPRERTNALVRCSIINEHRKRENNPLLTFLRMHVCIKKDNLLQQDLLYQHFQRYCAQRYCAETKSKNESKRAFEYNLKNTFLENFQYEFQRSRKKDKEKKDKRVQWLKDISIRATEDELPLPVRPLKDNRFDPWENFVLEQGARDVIPSASFVDPADSSDVTEVVAKPVVPSGRVDSDSDGSNEVVGVSSALQNEFCTNKSEANKKGREPRR